MLLQTKLYTIECRDDQFFQLTLTTDDESIYTFEFGSTKEPNCVQISFVEKGIAEISNLYYDGQCRENGVLERGSRGTLTMIYAALFCVTRLYPYEIKEISFDDASDIECFNDTIPLSYFKLFTEGRTWYEKHFPVYPYDSESYHKIANGKEELNTTVHISALQFRNHLITPLRNMNREAVLNYVLDIYQSALDTGVTWITFFKTIKNDESLGCRFFSSHMDKALRVLFKLPNLYFLKWTFDLEKLNFAPYQVTIREGSNDIGGFNKRGGRRIKWFNQHLGNVDDWS